MRKVILTEAENKIIQAILAKYPYTFYVFGSRVKGNVKPFSDLDLCYKEPISDNELFHLNDDFIESNLPFKVDIVDYQSCDKEFKKSISVDLILFKAAPNYHEEFFPTLHSSINFLSKKWQLTYLKIIDERNPIFFAYQKSFERFVVLKISLDPDNLTNELAALNHFNGQGCVQLYDYDLEHHALLLERAIPGIQLKTLFPHDDVLAMQYYLQVIKYLHAEPIKKFDHAFPQVEQWLQKYRLLNLLNNEKNLLLLHGDLHHENILSSERQGWLITDPKGVVGNLYYEIAWFICNPIEQLFQQKNLQFILERRLKIFSRQLNLDESLLKQWCEIKCHLAAEWDKEDNKDPNQWLTLKELFK